MYQLIDFGDRLKLESLSGHVIVRPSPAAEFTNRSDADRWASPDATYDLVSKSWKHAREWPQALLLDCGNFRMPVRPTPFGHIGVFPEQFDNWNWIQQRRPSGGSTSGEAPSEHGPLALNLFAYTGAATLALSLAGYDVVHVDAAKPNVMAAKQAAETNGLSGATIRYIVDDAAQFVSREVRRGRQYQAIVLDPPAYGHTPKGKTWRLERDLWPLLENALQLVDVLNFRLLISGHSPQVEAADVVDFLARFGSIGRAMKQGKVEIESGRSGLKDLSGRRLDAGFYVRAESVTGSA